MTRGRKKDPKVQELMKRCEELGIKYTSYCRRRQLGWTEEEALNTAKVGAYIRLKDGTSAYAYLKKHNGHYGTFYNFFALGYSADDAVEKALSHKPRQRYYRDGMTLRQYCIQHGLNYSAEYNKQKGEKNNDKHNESI